ncbi:hypothetical protein EIN_275200 [Entamoeba invadens IP1]|uniref:Uncharacterized protein n=1 Tax=Entamoeba invadens IP1 TaxID=370355 RepID=A0A0A1U4X5_ENTIV|nr:hypothetical protein EIN_275200 [Entamoeba invadens IP1]ELP87933.1 hypothetical protein EIN_275200 [Entamoeba invadens IP1]|eukprot:XP_004254704.1 hypothetical protein EIN_275200 [Entamoeba invadens IP1]
MKEYYETFGVMLLTLTLSFIFKLWFFRDNVRIHSGLIMKVLFNLSLPCIIFRNLYNMNGLDLESLYLVVGGFIYQFSIGGLACLVFLFIKNPDHRKLAIFNSLALNTALFIFPVLKSVAPTDGISKCILFCFSNDLCCYLVIRPLYAWLGLTQSTREKGEISIEMETISTSHSQTIPHDSHPSKESPQKENKDKDTTKLLNTSKDEEEEDHKTIHINEPGNVINDDSTQIDLGNATLVQQKKTSLKDIIIKKLTNKNTIQIAKGTLMAVITSIPIYATFSGYFFALTQFRLPHVLLTFIDTCANANSLLAYAILGSFFEWKIPKKYLLTCFSVVLYRMLFGLAFGLIVYFGFQKWIGPVARFVMLISPLTPAPLIDSIYTIEYKVTPQEIPIMINNLTIVCSYIGILILIPIINP